MQKGMSVSLNGDLPLGILTMSCRRNNEEDIVVGEVTA